MATVTTTWIPVLLQLISLSCGILIISITGMRLGSYETTFKKTALRSLFEIIVILLPILLIHNIKESNSWAPMVGMTMLSVLVTHTLRKKYVCGRRYDVVDLTGKVYIVTGANTGIGYETAKAILVMGGTVILACRSPERAAAAKAKLLQETRSAEAKVICIKLDLCGFDSVRKFVKQFRELSLPLHGLINNAGMMMSERNLTQDGFEMVFTANHLSHFLLTNLLLPELEKTEGRIVVLASSMHFQPKSFDFEDVMSERTYSLFKTYSQSKLANVLFAFEMQRRLTAKGSKVTCNVVHPGIVTTEVTRHMNAVIRVLESMFSFFLQFLRKTAEEGAYSSIFAATSPELATTGGLYIVHCEGVPASKAANDLVAAEKLWKLSEKLTGLSH